MAVPNQFSAFASTNQRFVSYLLNSTIIRHLQRTSATTILAALQAITTISKVLILVFIFAGIVSLVKLNHKIMAKGKKRSAGQESTVATEQTVEPILEEQKSIDYSLPQHNRQAAFSLLYLFVFSVMMFTLPFAAFFGVRNYLNEHMQVTQFQNTFYSVLSCVLTVNLIIVAYAVVAYRETEYDDQGNVIDQSVMPAPLVVASSKEELNLKKTK